jgi:Holliday junction resolvasome RuvABC endonuclease subunit
MRILGLDLSITSPAFCIMTVDDDTFKIIDIELHGFTDTIKWQYCGDNLTIHSIPENYKKHPPHYRATLILHVIDQYVNDIDYVAVEDYAYDGKGKIFDIAECSGALKNYFYVRNIPMKKYPPTTVKLAVTDNGRADKLLMLVYFKQSYLRTLINQHVFELPEADNPQEDLIDSIYMANVLRCELHYTKHGKIPDDHGMLYNPTIVALVKGKPGSKTRPAIEHPIIVFGGFTRPKAKKVEKKEKKVKEDKPVKVRSPKKKFENK